MKPLLGSAHRDVLARFAGHPTPNRVLLAFDYDGVLAPLVEDPHGATMRPATRALLARVARVYPTAVVSGRAWKDVHRFVGGIVPTLVGNHGFELGRPLPVPRAVLAQVRAWRARLEADLAGVPGVYFEDKRSTLSIHYGRTRAWRASERAVHGAANRLAGTRLVHGKKVLNVLPHDFPTKGDAVRTLLARQGLECALYAGDDVTDEDAFAVGPPLVLGVHVGKGPSLAPWCLRTQAEVDVLLERLLELRPRRAPAAGRAVVGRRAAR